MGKRKRSDDRDYYHVLRKVKKLESKLRKRQYSSSSISTESDHSEEETRYKRYYDLDIQGDDVIDVDEEYDVSPESFQMELGHTEAIEQAPSVPATSSAAPAPPPALAAPLAPTAPAAAPFAPPALPDMAIPGTSGVNTDEAHASHNTDETVPPLEPDILQLLGDDPTIERNYGENLHKDIAPRWAHILSNGLTKESQLELAKQYLPPKNCPNMAAPKLNLEIKAALSEINIKKDVYSQSKQNQLSNSLSAIGQVLNWALSPNSTVPQDIIKALSDAGRLICDSHYRESLSRRYAALNTLNRTIRDTVKNTQIDEHLFGAALSDHIKSSKAINKTGSEMKPAPLRSVYRLPPIAPPQRGALNSRGAPPRVPAAAEPRSTPARRRPPRDRRMEASRGRRPTNFNHTRRYHHMKRR